MSIAVAAVIRTPVCLRLLQALLGLCGVLAAWPLSGAWHVAALSGLGPAQSVGGYALGWPGALSSAAGGVFLLLAWLGTPSVHTAGPPSPCSTWRRCRCVGIRSLAGGLSQLLGRDAIGKVSGV